MPRPEPGRVKGYLKKDSISVNGLGSFWAFMVKLKHEQEEDEIWGIVSEVYAR